MTIPRRSIWRIRSKRIRPKEKKDADTLVRKMDAGQTDFNESEIELMKDALHFALKELGPKEFQTITGYGVGEQTLTILNKAEIG
jgi:hypothetical protein